MAGHRSREDRAVSRPFTDSHLHFDTFEAEQDIDAVLGRAAAAGVGRMVAIGGSASANTLAAALAETHRGTVFGVVGYDRDEAGREPSVDALSTLVHGPGIVGIGETGLDYHYSAGTADAQKALFECMLDLAAEHRLPVVVHSRDADDDTLRMLSDHGRHWRGRPDAIGVLHCFTGTDAFARRLLDLGFYIGFSGILTFRNADALRGVAKIVPMDRMLIETDAPYLAPVPHRGRRNEPAFVVHVARAMAELQGCTVEEAASITSRNASRLFGLDATDDGSNADSTP